jgi:hypothetical protein
MMQPQVTRSASNVPFLDLLACAENLTSLNIDWVLWRRPGSQDELTGHTVLSVLKNKKFPNLRAFQIRNAVVEQTRLPTGVYLLEPGFLDFLENHPKIQCLAFPIDRFYAHEKPSPEVQKRARHVVEHLGRTLVDLRIDSTPNGNGDPVTDKGLGGPVAEQERTRRRRFISDFAPHMTRVEHLKIEGGIPRDEKREIVRAMHTCPLKRLVLIGSTFPAGNTWGSGGEDLGEVDDGFDDQQYDLPEEVDIPSRDKWRRWLPAKDAAGRPTFEFEPTYGWPPSPPFLYTIGALHGNTIEELKLCGFHGSPVLSSLLGITDTLLIPLRLFPNLRQLVLSMWLVTWFEDAHRDTEIISFWKNARDPSSTALVVVPPAPSPPQVPQDLDFTPTAFPPPNDPDVQSPDFNRWEVALKTRFAPSALAYRLAADIGPFLSPVAKARDGGVRVRGSFCLGSRDVNAATDIFDLDIRIGEEDKVLEFVGPREEGEKSRARDKLESRRWF